MEDDEQDAGNGDTDGVDVGEVAVGNRPCLMFLDSLSMHPYTRIGKRLASYLYHERRARRKEKLSSQPGFVEEDVAENEFIKKVELVKCHVKQHTLRLGQPASDQLCCVLL
jgi:hypothetical protein